jgi:hypothetical protein
MLLRPGGSGGETIVCLLHGCGVHPVSWLFLNRKGGTTARNQRTFAVGNQRTFAVAANTRVPSYLQRRPPCTARVPGYLQQRQPCAASYGQHRRNPQTSEVKLVRTGARAKTSRTASKVWRRVRVQWAEKQAKKRRG